MWKLRHQGGFFPRPCGSYAPRSNPFKIFNQPMWKLQILGGTSWFFVSAGGIPWKIFFSYGTKGNPLKNTPKFYLSYHVTVTSQRMNPLQNFVLSYVSATYPIWKPLKNMSLPMCKIRPLGGTPCKFCVRQGGRYGTKVEPPIKWCHPMYQLQTQGVNPYKHFFWSWYPLKNLCKNMCQICPLGGKSCKKCIILWSAAYMNLRWEPLIVWQEEPLATTVSTHVGAKDPRGNPFKNLCQYIV